MSENTQLATFGAGCFWCVEAIYQDLRGVYSAVSGYSGGPGANPTYQQVCSGTTDHAEVVQISFDLAEISYADLLYIFWRTHDPTTLNRQGADSGTQYRSVIYYHDEEQRQLAEASRSETDISDLWPDPIITEISPAEAFYGAEDYHQNYYRQNPNQPYCSMVIDPKVQKFRKNFQERLRGAN
ncbi:MAG: peptide-methionine (S)-S-oxide reductase MsrA [Candidatus Latescibacterota bacterium]|jgi:peptide-methionine (S)-S-oxide reductase